MGEKLTKDDNPIMDEDEKVEVKELSREEKAAFIAHKWLLLSILLGTFIVLFVESDQSLRQLVMVMCLAYIGGAVYKWNRLKNIRMAKEAMGNG